jgi:hypothetical protein
VWWPAVVAALVMKMKQQVPRMYFPVCRKRGGNECMLADHDEILAV